MKGNKLICGIAVMVSLLTGCSLNSGTQKTESYAVLSIENEQLEDEIDNFLKGKETKDYFDINLAISENDKCFRYNVIDKYSNDNAFYFKVKSEDSYYLYRFQMGDTGKIVSYIKYNLEG